MQPIGGGIRGRRFHEQNAVSSQWGFLSFFPISPLGLNEIKNQTECGHLDAEQGAFLDLARIVELAVHGGGGVH